MDSPRQLPLQEAQAIITKPSLADRESQPLESPARAAWAALGGPESWLWLALAAVLLLLSNGANNVPAAAWLAPVFLLRFVRQQSLKVGLPVAYIALVAAFGSRGRSTDRRGE